MKRFFIFLIMTIVVNGSCKAQGVTFNHDEPFMQQFLFTVTGSDALTPEFYYWLFHSSYRKSHRNQGKLLFKTAMSTTVRLETKEAELLDSALVERAKVEAMNVVDRTPGPGDLAWLSEGPKIEKKLQQLQNSIQNITFSGGKKETADWFQLEFDQLEQAVESIREAYMPLGERKEQYLAIYDDIVYAIDKCENTVLFLKCHTMCNDMKQAQKNRRVQLGNIATQAHGRWKNNLMKASYSH